MINSILPALCLGIGFYFGFKIGETKKLPKLKKKEEKQIEEKESKEAKRLNRVLANLDRYDGTDKGQEEV